MVCMAAPLTIAPLSSRTTPPVVRSGAMLTPAHWEQPPFTNFD
jgi:hypothetical protein